MPVSSSETRRWKKKQKLGRKRKPQEDEIYEDEEEDEEIDEDNNNNNNNEPIQKNPTLALPEVISGSGLRISQFPSVIRHTVDKPHSSVLAVVAAERAARNGEAQEGRLSLENISHGQLQALSTVPRDCPALLEKDDVAAVFVVSAPKIVEGRGVVKRFGGRVHVVPMHADWFSPHSVHRLERQVVPHFFSRKSAVNTPEKYMDCRNRIVAKYMENPETRLTLADCQGWVTGLEMDDLTRIVRFLDHWGIINYCAASNNEPPSDHLFLKEDGEVHVPSAALRSIDSLIQFDKPRCKLKAVDMYPSLSSHDRKEADLDSTIREHLSENRCTCCSRSVAMVYYQSQKEVDSLLCVDCFNDGRFVTGHSSIDFVRLDTSRDYGDLDGESWTNQETLLLLEAMEIYDENWNEIAEHVGSKSKAQCILHFIRLPTEDGSLENMEVPSMSLPSTRSRKDVSLRPPSSSNGDLAVCCVRGSNLESEIPFADSANPVMALVAFLASAVGPRVAAACAHTSLAVLSADSPKVFCQSDASGVSKRTDGEGTENADGFSIEDNKKSEDNSQLRGQRNQNGEVTPLSADLVRAAAKAGLAAAAMKAKLFAEHEEREIQRLSANIINHQLKRLELKLKQFAEVETLLMKECEQVEKLRQRFGGERARLMAAQFGNSAATSSMNQPGITNNSVTNRQPGSTASSQQFLSLGYINNQPIHPQFMGRPQMYGLGPRLPLSALHPSSSASPSALFNSPANPQPSPSHQMLRSVSGGSSSLG